MKQYPVGMMMLLKAMRDDECVGTGYVVYHPFGCIGPYFVDNKGADLEIGWFKVEAVSQHPVIISDRIH